MSSRISGTIIDCRRELVEMITDFRVLPAAAFKSVQHSSVKSSSGAFGSATRRHSNELEDARLKSRRPFRGSACSERFSTSMVPSAISRMSSS